MQQTDDDQAGLGGRVTSYDVARRAGVSQSAVSRAFREGASISAELRARIHRAAAALGYAPSHIARALMTQRSRLVGVLVTEAKTHAARLAGGRGARLAAFADALGG